jgi:hypothetical protein
MDSAERELLTGMGNCFEACGGDFETTVGMVAHARRLTPAEVKDRLARMRRLYGEESEYLALRGRLPSSFPF